MYPKAGRVSQFGCCPGICAATSGPPTEVRTGNRENDLCRVILEGPSWSHSNVLLGYSLCKKDLLLRREEVIPPIGHCNSSNRMNKSNPKMSFSRFSQSGLCTKSISNSGVAPANQTKERSVHELFTGAFRNKVQCESCLLS